MNSASTSVTVKSSSERKFSSKPKPGQAVDLEVSVTCKPINLSEGSNGDTFVTKNG